MTYRGCKAFWLGTASVWCKWWPFIYILWKLNYFTSQISWNDTQAYQPTLRVSYYSISSQSSVQFYKLWLYTICSIMVICLLLTFSAAPCGAAEWFVLVYEGQLWLFFKGNQWSGPPYLVRQSGPLIRYPIRDGSVVSCRLVQAPPCGPSSMAMYLIGAA